MTEQKDLRRKAYVAIMLMGIVSMLGDIARALLMLGLVIVAQIIAIALLFGAKLEKKEQ